MSKKNIEEVELEGGAANHEGYTLVGTINDDDSGESAMFAFDDLLPQVRTHHVPGISMSLDQAQQNGKHGTISIRVIQDAKCRVYLFRKDEDGITSFKISTGLNVS